MDDTDHCPECKSQELRVESVRERTLKPDDPSKPPKVVAKTIWVHCEWCGHTWPVTKAVQSMKPFVEDDREKIMKDAPRITSERALAIAYADAIEAYRHPLRNHQIVIRLEENGWNIEFQFRPTAKYHTGGGPYYVINSETGEIVTNTYHQ